MCKNLEKTCFITLFVLLAGVLILITTFVSCDLSGGEGVSIEERIEMFMDDINAGNYSNLYKHIHPSADFYEQTHNAIYWNAPGVFPEDEKYTLDVIVPIGDVVTTILNSDISYSDATIIFVMKKDGDDYKILKITIEDEEILKNLVSR